MSGFGTISKNKESRDSVFNTSQQDLEQNQSFNGFEMIEDPKEMQKKPIDKEAGDLDGFDVIEADEIAGMQIGKKKEKAINFDQGAEILGRDQSIKEVEDYVKQQKARISEEYKNQVVDMKDTAKLGKKKTVFGKATSEKQKVRNAAIDKSKYLTNKATSLTFSAHEHILKINNEYNETNFQDKNEVFTKAIQNLVRAKDFLLEERCFERAMLIKKFDQYYRLIKDYELVKSTEKPMARLMAATLEELEPYITLLKKRLTVFAEQNRVRLDGSILGEKEEPATMKQGDVDAWKELFHPEEDELINDEERLRRRAEKEERGLKHAHPYGKHVGLTREDAMNTASDLRSQKKRDELRELNLKLYELGETKLAETINQYVVGTRYAVGYTEERERLMAAMKAVDRAAAKHAKRPVAKLLKTMKDYFSEMTNGTLEIPEGARIIECKDSAIKNEGKNDGSFANGVVWKSSHWSNQTDAPLFAHEPMVNDIKQRMVSNCYMMAGTAGIINVDPALIKTCLKDEGDGHVVVRLYDIDNAEEGEVPKPVYIRVKKTVPRIGSADALSAGTLWMQMIEKAFAFYGRNIRGQHVRGYRSLWYGTGSEYIKRLLGVGPIDCKQNLDKNDQEALYEEFKHIDTSKKVYSTGSGKKSGEGIQSGHAYTILGAEEINGIRYVRMRNPYSNHSLHYDEKGERSQTGVPFITFANSSDETYGQFRMKYDDFFKEYQVIYVSDLSVLDQKGQMTEEYKREQEEKKQKRLETLRKQEEERLKRQKEQQEQQEQQKQNNSEDDDDF